MRTIIGQAESLIGVDEHSWPSDVGIQDKYVTYSFQLLQDEGPDKVSKIIFYMGSDD